MTVKIGFDESHSETWTIDLAKAAEINHSLPEYHYYGHLAKIIEKSVHGKIKRLTESWSSITLDAIAHPADSTIERGCGGMFVIGEYNISHWGSNINDVLVPFGITFSDDTLSVGQKDPNSHILARHFLCSNVIEHQVTDGVRKISYHRGCAVRVDTNHANSLILAPQGQSVCAVSSYGNGNPYDPKMKYDLDLMVGLNKQAKEALTEIKSSANKVKNYARLEEGDLLIIDNRKNVHGSSQFIPRYDGMARWLQRVYVVRDIAASEEERDKLERIITTEFAV